MDQKTFDSLATELAEQFTRTYPGTRLYLAVFPPGSLDGSERGAPLSASTLPIEVQPMVLRMLATNMERNDVEVIFSKIPR